MIRSETNHLAQADQQKPFRSIRPSALAHSVRAFHGYNRPNGRIKAAELNSGPLTALAMFGSIRFYRPC